MHSRYNFVATHYTHSFIRSGGVMTNADEYTRRFIGFQKPYSSLPYAIRWRSAYVRKEYFLHANRLDLLNGSLRLQSCSFDAPSLQFSRFSYIVSEWNIMADSKFNFFPRFFLSYRTVIRLAINLKKKNIAERKTF